MERSSEIQRNAYLARLIAKRHNGMIKVVTGMRRCGKSYLLFKIFVDYLLEHGVQPQQIVQIVLDDDEFASLRNPLRLGEYIRARTEGGNTQYYVLIDEIQYCAKVENPDLPGDFITFYNVLNGLLRREQVDVYVTGSNSRMLSSDILTEFRGRGDQVHVRPLAFAEYYEAKQSSLDFEDAFAEYLTYGGLPRVCLYSSDEEKSLYLKNLFEEVYIKDIVQRNGLKSEEAIRDLMRVLASAIGSFTNPSRIEQTFKSRLNATYTSKTIFNHISLLKDSFLVEEARRYDVKGRRYIGANAKYYFTDTGLRNALLNFRQTEQTHLMENVLYNELLFRGYNVDVGIVEINERVSAAKNTRRQLEVDFVANKGNKKFYIQSALSLEPEEKSRQERRSLSRIDDSFKKIIVTKDRVKASLDESGFLICNVKDFLLDRNLLDGADYPS